MQGSLLSIILSEPVTLSSVIIGSECFNLESCKRAFFARYPDNNKHLEIHNYTQAEFVDQRHVDKVPCPDSSLFVAGSQSFREAYVAGLRQGWSKKKLDNPKSWSSVCQTKLASRTQDIMKMFQSNQTPDSLEDETSCDNFTYGSLKQMASDYNSSKAIFKVNLKNWPDKKAELYNFEL
eukprot:TRINITY_DN6848_c0_g1_i4.p1 TRINITY_DN6848_c0_g1~~TRINITY_DN6848_c0_g1_i4.p1  ORF type:complete len:179 (-),score=9.63 TRINITY_DN6848_c0_g1_i4:94-630(-)